MGLRVVERPVVWHAKKTQKIKTWPKSTFSVNLLEAMQNLNALLFWPQGAILSTSFDAFGLD